MSEHTNYNRRLGTITCDYCGKEFQRPLSEITRSLNKKRKSYCSRECAALGAAKSRSELPPRPRTEAELNHLHSICGNLRDDFTPFRYTLRCTLRRFKEADITLEDLKEVWEQQNGICPYTGYKLILPENGNIHEIDFFHRASLDRIDSTKGYVKGNIQFVATPINYMKNTQSDEAVKNFLKEISEFTSKLL